MPGLHSLPQESCYVGLHGRTASSFMPHFFYCKVREDLTPHCPKTDFSATVVRSMTAQGSIPVRGLLCTIDVCLYLLQHLICPKSHTQSFSIVGQRAQTSPCGKRNGFVISPVRNLWAGHTRSPRQVLVKRLLHSSPEHPKSQPQGFSDLAFPFSKVACWSSE